MAKAKKAAKAKNPLAVGNIVLIRTAVYHAVGRVAGFERVGSVDFVVLEEAAYLGDTGRYHEATSKDISTVAQAEIEPVGLGGVLAIQVGSICDVALTPAVCRAVK